MFTFVWMHVYYWSFWAQKQLFCSMERLDYIHTVSQLHPALFEGNQNADLAFRENDFDASGSNLEGLQGRNLNPERGSHKDRTINQAEICPSVWRRWIPSASIKNIQQDLFPSSQPIIPISFPYSGARRHWMALISLNKLAPILIPPSEKRTPSPHPSLTWRRKEKKKKPPIHNHYLRADWQ